MGARLIGGHQAGRSQGVSHEPPQALYCHDQETFRQQMIKINVPSIRMHIDFFFTSKFSRPPTFSSSHYEIPKISHFPSFDLCTCQGALSASGLLFFSSLSASSFSFMANTILWRKVISLMPLNQQEVMSRQRLPEQAQKSLVPPSPQDPDHGGVRP